MTAEPRVFRVNALPIVLALSIGLLVAQLGCRSRDTIHRTERASAASAQSSASVPPAAVSVPSLVESAKAPPSLDALDLERLPPIAAPACSAGARDRFLALPASKWKPVLEPIQKNWHPGDGYPPETCIRSVRARCAPDLDGAPGDEVLIEVTYRVPQIHYDDHNKEVKPTCSAKEWVGDLTAVVALTPPAATEAGWAFRGLVGFVNRSTGEGAREIRFKRFVRLPDGRTGVYARHVTPGFTDEDDVVLVYGRESWVWPVATSRVVPVAR
jgi:hypothetical protein